MIDSYQLATLMVCAVRYSHSRRSYMPSLVCDIIRDNIHLLDDNAKEQLMKDIRRLQQERPDVLYYDEWQRIIDDYSTD